MQAVVFSLAPKTHLRLEHAPRQKSSMVVCAQFACHRMWVQFVIRSCDDLFDHRSKKRRKNEIHTPLESSVDFVCLCSLRRCEELFAAVLASFDFCRPPHGFSCLARLGGVFLARRPRALTSVGIMARFFFSSLHGRDTCFACDLCDALASAYVD